MSNELNFLASNLYDMDSLRNLFAALNFEFSDDSVSKSTWTDGEKNSISESEIVATKFGYNVYYLRTRESDFKPIKPILAKIIKADNGLCLVCSHNPNGFKWIFSISYNHSSSFNKTYDLPLVTTKDTQISKTSLEFLRNIRAPKKSNAIALQEQIAKAYDTFMVKIRHNEDSKYEAGERSRAFSEVAYVAAPGHQSADLRFTTGAKLSEQDRRIRVVDLAEVTHAVALAPRAVDLRLAMGNKIDGLDLYSSAAGLAELERAVSLKPRAVDLRLAMGAMLHELGRHAKAAAAFDKAVCLAPEEPAALAGLGISLWHLGNHAESLDAFSRATELEPNNAELHIGAGNVLLDLGRDAEADCAFARAAELEQGSGKERERAARTPVGGGA